MGKPMRTCTVCHDKYEYCPYCSGNRETYVLFCGKNCRTIYDTFASSCDGQIDDIKAKEIISKCDLSKRGQFTKTLNAWIDRILGSAKAEVAKPVTTDKANKEFDRTNKEFKENKKGFFRNK